MNMLRKVTVQRRRPGRSRRRAWCAVTAGGMAAAVSLTASPALAAALVRSGGGPERGIDISAYQNANGPINWRELAGHGIRFVAIKASEDTYYTNPYYLPDARAASRAGLAVLAYAFANPDRAGGAATASFAVRAARYRRGHGALPLVVDLENDPYSTNDCYWFGRGRMIAWIAGFTSRARALTGSWPIIYTTVAWWRECTGSTGRFRRDPLWLADYNGGRPAAPSAVDAVVVLAVQRGGLPARDRLDRPRRFPVGQRAPVAPPGLGAEAPPPPQAPVQAPAEAQEAQEARKKPRRRKRQEAETGTGRNGRSGPGASERRKHLPVTNHQLPTHPHQSRLIGSAGDSAQASPRYRGNHAHHRRRARARGRGADRGPGDRRRSRPPRAGRPGHGRF